MTDQRYKVIRRVIRLLGVAATVWVVVFVVYLVADIQGRLRRNGAIAQRLVASLQARFPGYQFQAAPGYDKEIIYVQVASRVTAAERREIEALLRREKVEHRLGPDIQIWFQHESDPQASEVLIK